MEGADPNPNFGSHKGRLGKVSNRLQRRAEFSSMPIHVACTQGNYELIKALIQFGSKCSAPDASAIYPVHLACTSLVGNQQNTPKDAEKPEQDYERRLCHDDVRPGLCPYYYEGWKQTKYTSLFSEGW